MNVIGMHYQVPHVWTAVKTALGAAVLEGFKAVDVIHLQQASRLDPESAAKAWQDVQLTVFTEAHKYLNQLGQRSHLVNIVGLKGETAFDLAQNLLSAMCTEETAAKRVMNQIKGLPFGDMDKNSQIVFGMHYFRKIATNVLSELRNRMDAQGFLESRAACYDATSDGEHMTANRVSELATTEQVRNSLMNFLSNWTNYPALVERVIGEKIHFAVEPLAISRARKSNRLPAEWIMRWDEHYVEIQTEIARAAGAPLSPTQQAKLKRPLFSKHGKHYTFTKAAVQKHLDFLTAWIAPIELGGDDAIDAVVRILVNQGDLVGNRLIKKPELFDDYNHHGQDDAAQDDEAEQIDDDSSPRTSPGKHEETDLIDIDPADLPSDASDPAYTASDKTQTTANDDPDKMRKRCLHKYPVLYQAGILLSISPATCKNELFATFLDMGVFTLIKQVPNMKNVTMPRLAACCNDDAGKALSTAAFTAKVKVMTIEFMTAARELMKANSRRESHDAN